MATFEETIEKAVQAAVKRANAYTDTKVGALPRIPHVYATTMVELGFTKGATVSVKDFLLALYNKGYQVGDLVSFGYSNAGAAIVSDGTNTININCVDVIIGTLQNLNNAWARASVLVFGTGYAGKCARIGASTGETAGMLFVGEVQNL